jgi:hypothetical protein
VQHDLAAGSSGDGERELGRTATVTEVSRFEGSAAVS